MLQHAKRASMVNDENRLSPGSPIQLGRKGDTWRIQLVSPVLRTAAKVFPGVKSSSPALNLLQHERSPLQRLNQMHR